ncbi:MAG: PASTA domain-containing protein [Oscillospiraceae bacterium]
MDNQIVCEGCLSYIPFGKSECPYCGHLFNNTNPEGSLAIGTLLHGYTIGKCIMVDSEGVIYEAICNETKRAVMIKEFAPSALCCARDEHGLIVPRGGKEVLFKTVRMDFKELYTKLALLRSEQGLISVLDVFDDSDTSYGVLENAKPYTLQDYLNSRTVNLTFREALSLLRPITNGVRAMHHIGLVHRGISPQTVYITEMGEAKLGGYATLGMRTNGSELKCELFSGFAAPEQYSIAEFDGHYTDIYALGALYYYAISNKAPTSAEIRRKNDTMPCLRSLVPNTPAYLSSAIARAMRITPTERMQTSDSFLLAVSEAQKQDKRHLSDTKRSVLIAVALGLCVLIILALCIFASFNKSNNDVPQDTSSSTIPAAPIAFLAPDFIGDLYTEVQSDTKYIGEIVFTVEEAYSSIFHSGEIMEQSPVAGAALDDTRVMKLKISRGPETAIMPNVIGMPRVDAKALLNELKIKCDIVALKNDGSFLPDTVAKQDRAENTVMNVDTDSVVLYIADEVEAPDSSVPNISVSTIE